MSDDFWDTLKVATQVLQPALVALRYCDDMKGGTLSLLYILLLELDTTYSKPIKGLDEKIRTKLHNVFMSRWSAFHAPVHSAAFAMDRQFCRRDEGWIHSQRRNRLDQKLVEKLVRAHTNLVLRESLDDSLRHLLPWDIDLVIDDPVDEQEEEPEV
jgi:hypothetical protein